MAQLTKEDVLKLARLSRLHLSDEEVQSFAVDINAILDYVQQLQGVDLDEYEPTLQVNNLKNVMREDEIIDYGVTPKQLLKNAPEQKDGHIKVKRMLA